MCTDYRGINAITKRDAYPLPNIDDLLFTIGPKRFFSSLDLFSGFWQIKLHPDSKEKTAFSTPAGHYRWLVLPMGLTNAPSSFQRLMNTVLGDLSFVCVYLDDILIFLIHLMNI